MKKTIGLAVAGALVALLPVATAYALIGNSKHDLSSGSSASIKSSGTDQVCVFCHTPHNAMSTQVLWNHKASLNSSFSWGDTATSAGTTLPTALSTRSMRCLACHDGSVGLGDVSNFGGAAVSLGMTGPSGALAGNNLADPYYLVGSAGKLQGNHPVGIPYPGQAAKYNNITSGNTAGTGYNAAPSAAVLFTDSSAGNGGKGIECGSCHDVHNSTGAEKFLWKSNAGSALCLDCHAK